MARILESDEAGVRIQIREKKKYPCSYRIVSNIFTVFFALQQKKKNSTQPTTWVTEIGKLLN